MNIHLLLLIGVLIVSLFYPTHPTLKRKRIVVGIITMALTLFGGLRTWWMGDLIKYYTLYRACNGVDWNARVFGEWSNVGIRVLFRLAGAVGVSYDICIFIIAAFVAVSLGILVFRYSTSPFVSYLMYIGMGFLIFTFSGLKQAIAMGFLCFAMMEILENKFRGFILWTLVAGLFHTPALVFLLAYPFAHKRVDNLYFLFLAAGFAIVFLFRNQLVSVLSELYNDDANAYSLNDTRIVGGRFWMMLLILAVGYYLRPIKSKDTTYTKVFSVMVLASLFQTFSVYNNVFSRLADYYFQFIVLFLPMALQPCGELAEEKAQAESPGYYRPREVYTIAALAITAYAVYYYIGYINSPSYLSSFKFCWEINPYALYGS